MRKHFQHRSRRISLGMQRDQLILERRDKNKRYSPVKGWTEAVDLRAGDILVLVNGEHVIVEKIQHEILESLINVYNFQVEDYHTYYVGKGILVHNTCTRRAAMRKAKRSVNIPMSATPDYVESVKMVGQNGRPISNGRHFWY